MYLHAYDYLFKGSCSKNSEEEKGQKFMNQTAHRLKTNSNKINMVFRKADYDDIKLYIFPIDSEAV